MIGERRVLCLDSAMPRVAIRDFGDPRLADYQNLKDATLASQRGRFIVEGRGNLEVLFARSSYRPVSILLSERAERSMALWLKETEPVCPVYVAEQPVLDRVVGFPIHRGCLAACERGEARDAMELAAVLLEDEAAPRILVLEGLSNHDNVGGIFRNAMALGGRGVILCPKTCDPLYRKAIRTSMGGSLCVPFARAADWPAALGKLRDQGYEVVALDPGQANIELDDFDLRRLGPTALLLGTEGAGLSDEALAHADRCLRIGMEAGVDSLNVSVAAAIALHSLRDRRPNGSAEI
jgi:tRNA G18 (ribose-2'-O)-methylase SpoU